jgi:chloramphenicol-sensitive protein RarD
MWGAMPIYWKAIEAVSSFEILGHRVIWSVVFTLVLITLKETGRSLQNAQVKKKRCVMAGGRMASLSLSLGSLLYGQ